MFKKHTLIGYFNVLFIYSFIFDNSNMKEYACCIINRGSYTSGPFHMKFMKRAFGSFHKFHMK